MKKTLIVLMSCLAMSTVVADGNGFAFEMPRSDFSSVTSYFSDDEEAGDFAEQIADCLLPSEAMCARLKTACSITKRSLEVAGIVVLAVLMMHEGILAMVPDVSQGCLLERP